MQAAAGVDLLAIVRCGIDARKANGILAPSGPSPERWQAHLKHVRWKETGSMTARAGAGLLMLGTVLGVLWLKASTAWFFMLF